MDHRVVPTRKHGGGAGRLPVLLLSLGVFLLEAAPARADGKLYARDEIPSRGAYQRAMLLHQDGQEILVLQPKLVGEAKEFGWIVPVPAEPRLGSLPEGLDDELFLNLSYRTRPQLDFSDAIRAGVIAMELLGVLGLILWGWRRPHRRVGAWLAAVYLFILAGFMVPVEFRGRGMLAVDVLQSERVGIYDVIVIRARATADLRAWLEKHGFRSGPEDDAVLASYIARGWCFVTARIAGNVDTKSTHLIQGLILLFQATEPIYPFALTATSGGETEVLLYVLAGGKVSHPSLEIQYAAPFDDPWMTQDFLDRIDWSDKLGIEAPPPLPRFLTKLKGRLSSRNAAGDLLFSMPGDEPYQDVKYVWW